MAPRVAPDQRRELGVTGGRLEVGCEGFGCHGTRVILVGGGAACRS
jgi:hypothetical protein